MFISYKHRFIYMPPPKTGTTTICHVLHKHFDADAFHNWKFPRGRRHYRNKQAIPDKHLIHVPEEFKDYFIFASIRNPFSILPARFALGKNLQSADARGSFPDFLKAVLPKMEYSLFYQLRRHDTYKPPQGCVPFGINAYIRLESIQEDFDKLPFVKGQTIKLPHLQTRNPPSRRPLFSQELVDLVLEHRAIDFEYFDYPKKVPKRLLREQANPRRKKRKRRRKKR